MLVLNDWNILAKMINLVGCVTFSTQEVKLLSGTVARVIWLNISSYWKASRGLSETFCILIGKDQQER